MVLDRETTREVERFVQEKPRTIQEVAQKVKKSWRTADRYVNEIAREQGTLSVRTFRGGTRGALKIVYWNTEEQVTSTRFQELLYRKIESGRCNQDFSPFDIYQCVDVQKRNAFVERQKEEYVSVKHNLAGMLGRAEEQILIFSGNLSWATLQQGKRPFLKVFEELADRGISIKILGKVDLTSIQNAEDLLQINDRVGSDAIQIRHAEQPLRAFVVDSVFTQLKERKNMEPRKKEEARKLYVFYEIYQREWVKWTRKVFWSFYREALPAERRIKDLNTIQALSE